MYLCLLSICRDLLGRIDDLVDVPLFLQVLHLQAEYENLG